MKRFSSIALFATLMWCASAAPMSGGHKGLGAQGNSTKPGLTHGGQGVGGAQGAIGGHMVMPLNISSKCLAAIHTTCSACPAAPPTNTTTKPAAGKGNGTHPEAAGNYTKACFECIQTNSDALIAAGCDHLKCPAAMASTCPECPWPHSNDSCHALCAANGNKTECSACRSKCRACIDQNTDALIDAGCKALACAKVINTTCPDCVPTDACRAACKANHTSRACAQCQAKHTACATCLTANNATLTAAGCPQPSESLEGGKLVSGGAHDVHPVKGGNSTVNDASHPAKGGNSTVNDASHPAKGGNSTLNSANHDHPAKGGNTTVNGASHMLNSTNHH